MMEGVTQDPDGNLLHIDCHYVYNEFERKYGDMVIEDFDTEKKKRGKGKKRDT